MGRQRSAVHPALGRTTRSFNRCSVFAFGIVVGFDLFGLFQPQQQLIFRQRLGAPAKTVALQLLDDLFQSFGARAFRKQHRLQRGRIVGKGIRHRHDGSRS